MKNTLLIIVILIISKFDGFSQAKEDQIKKDSISITTYNNYGISIPFKGWIKIIKNDHDEGSTYFYKSIEIIRFNENKKIIDRNTQHLLSEVTFTLEEMESFRIKRDTGWINTLVLDTNQINTNDSIVIKKNHPPPSGDNNISKKEKTNYSSLSNPFTYRSHFSSLYILPKISKRKLKMEIESYVKKDPLYQITEELTKNKGVFKWRIQNGKTRFDHYMVFGKDYNYLFVSSPYGSNGVIEKVIMEVEL